MTGVDFFMYCLGLSTVLVAGSGSVFLLRSSTRKRLPEKAEHVNQAGESLVKRLLETQQAQYASPIVRRELPPHVGPRPHKRTIVTEPPVQGKG